MLHCNLELWAKRTPFSQSCFSTKVFLSPQQNQTYDSHRAGDGRAKGEMERKTCCHSGTVLAQVSFEHWASPSQQQYWRVQLTTRWGLELLLLSLSFCSGHTVCTMLHPDTYIYPQDYFHAVQVPWFFYSCLSIWLRPTWYYASFCL